MKTTGSTGAFVTALLLGGCTLSSCQNAPKPPIKTAQTARPPQQAVTSVTPITFAPRVNDQGKIVGMGQQWFYYDAATGKASTPGGPTLTSAGSTIPITIMSMNSASFGGTMSYLYKDVLLDLAGIQDRKSYPLAVVQVNGDQQLVLVAIQGHKDLLIDDHYNVFADDSRMTSAGAPSVTIHIVAMRPAGAKDDPMPSLHGVLERGGGRKQSFETDKDGEADILLEDVSETKVDVVATDASGETVKSLIPLPIRGGSKGLVTQSVVLELGKQK